MVYRVIVLLALCVWINGCAGAPPKTKVKSIGSVSVTAIYAQSVGDSQKDVAHFVEQNLKEQKTFGYVKPYIPVIEQPIVRKVWVPDHKSDQDGGVLVGGHWVYVMIEGPRWFVEEQTQEAHLPVIVPSIPKEKEHASTN